MKYNYSVFIFPLTDANVSQPAYATPQTGLAQRHEAFAGRSG